MLKYDIEKHRQDVRAAAPSEAWEEKDTIELRTLHQPTPSVFFLFLRFLERSKRSILDIPCVFRAEASIGQIQLFR